MNMIKQLEPIGHDWYFSDEKHSVDDECGQVYVMSRSNAGFIEHASLRVVTIPRDKAMVNAVIAEPGKYSSERFSYAGAAYSIIEEAKSTAQKCGQEVITIEEADFTAIDEKGIVHAAWLVTKNDDKIRLNTLNTPSDKAVDIAQSICKAVRLMEKQGVVLPCILPTTIHTDAKGQAYIESVSAVRQAYSDLSSCRYCAPEVKAGGSGGYAATVYSIGAIAYEMLTHSRFNGTVGNSRGAIMQVLRQACADNQSDRFLNADTLSRALEAAKEQNEAEIDEPQTETMDDAGGSAERYEEQPKQVKKTRKWKLLWLLVPIVAIVAIKLFPSISSKDGDKGANNNPITTTPTTIVPTGASMITQAPNATFTTAPRTATPTAKPIETPVPSPSAIPLSFDPEQYKCEGVDIGHEHVIAVQSNGKVVAAGSNAYGQCNVSSWNNIVEVAAGFTFSLGLRSDGTIVSAGEDYDNEYGSLKVDWSRISSWRNIEHISAYGHGIIALDKTGKVHIEGGPHDEEGKYELPSWVNNKRAVEVSAGCNHMMVLYEDGTVGAFGVNKRPENVGAYTYTKGSCDLGEWHDIVAIAAAGDGSVGLMADGTVVYEGVNTKSQHSTYTSLRNVAAISSKGWHLLYITFDGQVGAVGWSDDDRCNVNAWNSVPGKKLVAVATSAWNNVFVFNDGSAVMTGQSYILRNTADKVKQWKNIVPKR